MAYMMNEWQDVHGAGSQKADIMIGDPASFPQGRGPQGDAVRIYNYVRLVRDTQCGQPGYVSGLAGDLNDDCYVNWMDMAALGRQWQSGYDLSVLTTIAENWLTCNDPYGNCH